MTGIEIGIAAIAVLLVLILLGLPIGVAMMVSSFGAVAFIRNETVAFRMLGSVANDSLEEYLYAIVPLFVLMGLLVTISGVGKDTFDLFERMLRRFRTGLGIATVFANAIFASITGISVASASVFSRIAVPEMVRHGYTPKFSTGVVAGSSVLGMLIPPSLLMVVYAVLAEESVGRMFLSGVGPGILLSILFAVTIMLMAWRRPASVFEREGTRVDGRETIGLLDGVRKGAPILALMTVVLGGLYGGFLNPTEAGAMGALGALLIALARRSLTPSSFWSLLVETGQITVSVLFLIVAATFFSRMLAMSGLPLALAEFLIGGTLGPWGFMLVFISLVILMGCFIDSISIMLILLPIALPVAQAAGFDMIWFGVMTVIAVEIGLLTPPFGLSAYTVKSALNDPRLRVGDIFRGSFPFVLTMVVCLIVLAIFPQIATWLARL
ncbi:C4-dicarboxylate ABC transporter permease [Mesorhizobium sp. L-8-10]|uniref:TRAP transporter large permease n=1 Tax=Mesorhizobium sp. L-8-10 TaxID=2744523 RepID=UPI0019293BF0|nr:TRAP transporter large permease [Mesorhizobium sp. L-8-10]BCH28624.1 C4-dicarboxylate ABC transporter permease [Mesorhizobium sp. L-8-10]